MKSKFLFLGLILSLSLSAQAKILNIDCHDPVVATDDIVEGYDANITALFSGVPPKISFKRASHIEEIFRNNEKQILYDLTARTDLGFFELKSPIHSQEDERHVIFNLPGRGLSMIKQAVTGSQSGSFSRFVIYECSVN